MKNIPFKNQYIDLGDRFYVKTDPVPVSNPKLIKFNEVLADNLGLSKANLNSVQGTAIFSGNTTPEGAEPLAMVYAGHQFGQYNPQLGDGRAILLGEIIATDGTRYDMQLKGSGRTFYSRNGDGRAALGPVLREYLISEAMVKLGVPTTRALAVVTTGEEVAREKLLPGGIITRVATSFVRVGTFQYFAAKGDENAVQVLSDHVIKRNFPQAGVAENPYIALLSEVADRQAALIAQWMQLGFIHGVMNTDNMSIAGETIDYGPCAFMDAYSHDRVFSYIDRQGRYAYCNQPAIGQWNITRFAECLLPLLADSVEAAVEVAENILKTYVERYESYWLDGMRSKLGLSNNSEENAKNDKKLINDLLNIMSVNSADYTLTFSYLSQLTSNSSSTTKYDKKVENLFDDPTDFVAWLIKWRKRISLEKENNEERLADMQAVNPVYIPRNHQIEAAIRAAEDHDDFSAFHALHAVLQNPYKSQNGKKGYSLPPEPGEIISQTFCGT